MKHSVALLGLVCLAGWTAPAGAGIWQDLYHGLDLLATPSGTPLSSVTGGGRSNGDRFGRLRIVPNQPGGGYDLEFDRTFGNDTAGRAEVLDFGDIEITLEGATQATLGYTTRGVPTLSTNLLINNVQYAIGGASGVQDAVLSGQLGLLQSLEINRLGFYSFSLQANNANSTLTLDGIVVDGTQDADFTIGPINVKGNIFFDLAVAGLTSLGVDTTTIEGLFPNSPINRIDEEIRDALAEQAAVLGITVGESGAAERALGESASSLVLSASELRITPDTSLLPWTEGAAGVSQLVPEPGSMLLLALGAAAVLRRR